MLFSCHYIPILNLSTKKKKEKGSFAMLPTPQIWQALLPLSDIIYSGIYSFKGYYLFWEYSLSACSAAIVAPAPFLPFFTVSRGKQE